jgi:hypothetical protein
MSLTFKMLTTAYLITVATILVLFGGMWWVSGSMACSLPIAIVIYDLWKIRKRNIRRENFVVDMDVSTMYPSMTSSNSATVKTSTKMSSSFFSKEEFEL